MRFLNNSVTAQMGIFLNPFKDNFYDTIYETMVPLVTQVFSFADLNSIPTY